MHQTSGLEGLLPILPRWMWLGAGALLAVVVLVTVIAALLSTVRRKRPARSADDPANLTIDIAALPAHGPSGSGPQLEVHGTPVRLAVLVLAPLGRSPLPSAAELPQVLENLAPGLMTVVESHQPVFRRWPGQLSVAGFVQAFFNNLSLPGDRGRRTPWCSLAGKFDAGDQPLLIGLVACAAAPNSLSQAQVEREGQWPELLRVKASR